MVLLCRNGATINVHVKTQKRVKHWVWHTDPWPKLTRPKSLIQWPGDPVSSLLDGHCSSHYGTMWPFMCWCGVKNLLTHWWHSCDKSWLVFSGPPCMLLYRVTLLFSVTLDAVFNQDYDCTEASEATSWDVTDSVSQRQITLLYTELLHTGLLTYWLAVMLFRVTTWLAWQHQSHWRSALSDICSEFMHDCKR